MSTVLKRLMRVGSIVATLAVAACAHVTGPARDLVITTTASQTSFRPGDTVLVRVTVANVGAKTEEITGRLCMDFPFVVTTLNSVEVGPGRASDFCLASLTLTKLAPGQSYVFSTAWTGSSNTGTAASPVMLPAGRYLLRGRIPGVSPRESATVPIEVLE